MLKRICIILAVLVLAASFSSCSDSEKGADGIFNAVISSNPQNLDPQLAVDEQSFFIIKNTYATLFDMDENGALVNGAVKSYSVSEDGRSYTFQLRDGLMWYGVSADEPIPLTAYDYEFAFRRIFDEQSHSPYSKLFSKIKNSLAVYGGVMSADELGVHALTDKTLKIELENADCDFLKLLAHHASSPCNEEIFRSTQGRYGLSLYDTYSCGAFYVSDWNYDPYWTDNHITLEPIKANSQDGYRTYPAIVNVKITDDRRAYAISENVVIDGYAIDNIADFTKDVGRDYDLSEYCVGTTFLFISPQSPIIDSYKVRSAIAGAIDYDKINRECINENSSKAVFMLPDWITVVNKRLSDLYPEGFERIKYKDIYSDYWNEFSQSHPEIDFNSYILLVSDEYASSDVPYSIISDFEERLNLYCTPVFENNENFGKRIAEGEYDMCIDTIYPDFNYADDFYEKLTGRIYPKDNKLAEYKTEFGRQINLQNKGNLLLEAEQYLIDNALAIPLTSEKKYFLRNKDTEDLWYDPFTDVIYFKYAKKY